MTKKLTFNEFLERAKKKHTNDDYEYDEATFNGLHHKMRIVCPLHGEFWQSANDHLRGQGCPICGKLRGGLKCRSNKTDFVKKYTDRYDERYDFSKFNYVKSNIKGTVICGRHGEFEATPNNLLSGEGCPMCKSENNSRSQRLSEQVINERLKNVHGNNITCDLSTYKSNNREARFICSKHGDFYSFPSNVFIGHGCPICGRKKCDDARKTQYDDVLARFEMVHGDKYTYDKATYDGVKKKMRIVCKKHGEFWQAPQNHWRGQGCPICKESKLEMEVSNALTEHGIEFIRERKLGRQHVDFYIPSIHVNIECQGEQHFKKKFGDKFDFNTCLERDIRKASAIKELGETVVYYTRKNLLPKNVNDSKFNGIYNNDNLFCDLDELIGLLQSSSNTISPQS